MIDGIRLNHTSPALEVRHDINEDEKEKKIKCTCALGAIRVIRCDAGAKACVVAKVTGFATSDYQARVFARQAVDKAEGLNFMPYLVKVEFEARVPDGYELDVGVLYGDVFVHGAFAKVKVGVLSGRLTCKGSYEALVARSLGGRVEFKGVATLGVDVRSVAGEVSVRWIGMRPCVQTKATHLRLRGAPSDPDALALLIAACDKGTLDVIVDHRFVTACPPPEPPPPDIFSNRMPSSSSTPPRPKKRSKVVDDDDEQEMDDERAGGEGDEKQKWKNLFDEIRQLKKEVAVEVE